MLLQINAIPVPINIIQVYAPTTEQDEEEVEYLYQKISELLKKLPKQELTVIMGDFNAKVGKGSTGNHIGPYGLGERNERGERLSIFASEENFVITNTFFQLPKRRLYTWKSPADTPKNNIRNQIDYILVNHRYRNSIISAKTYPGADLHSDHNPLVGSLRVKLKKVKKKSTLKYDCKRIKDPVTRIQVKNKLNTDYEKTVTNLNVENEIEKLYKTVEIIKSDMLQPHTDKKKSWMTDEILQLMEKRRVYKNSPQEYKNTQRIIKRKIKEAKEKEMKEK